MKAKLIVEGKEFDIDILDPELKKLVKPTKKTGYERVEEGRTFYYVYSDGSTDHCLDDDGDYSRDCYDAANYYSDKTVAENNIRADRLMRQLRRFSVEHREKSFEWTEYTPVKWIIMYDHRQKQFNYGTVHCTQDFGTIYFESDRACELAVETFHDELIWYFTEYKDSL